MYPKCLPIPQCFGTSAPGGHLFKEAFRVKALITWQEKTRSDTLIKPQEFLGLKGETEPQNRKNNLATGDLGAIHIFFKFFISSLRTPNRLTKTSLLPVEETKVLRDQATFSL